MKIKNLELIVIINILSSFNDKKLPQKISYAITRNYMILEKEYQYYDKEEQQLLHLKELLSNGEKSMTEYEKSKYSLNELIFEILKERDYLYLHFPDGYRLSTDISFLKRIRAEIDFFLKDIKYAKKSF